MRKYLLIFLILAGFSKLGAETILLIYPPSFNQRISGRYVEFNLVGREELPDSVYNLPVEVRRTFAEFSRADLMATGGLSFFLKMEILTP